MVELYCEVTIGVFSGITLRGQATSLGASFLAGLVEASTAAGVQVCTALSLPLAQGDTVILSYKRLAFPVKLGADNPQRVASAFMTLLFYMYTVSNCHALGI